MADIVSKKTRSRMMSSIRGKDTKPEMVVRKYLHAHGFRYRLHDKKLPGKPDLVLKKYNVVIFINGCYWHRHEGCELATTPSTNTAFWTNKFEKTKQRDIRNINTIHALGWRTVTVWECALRGQGLTRTLKLVTSAIIENPDQHIVIQ